MGLNRQWTFHFNIIIDIMIISHIQGEDTLAKMTKLAYSHFSCGYFEKDRLLFSLMLTTEVSAAVYNVIYLNTSNCTIFQALFVCNVL